MLCHRACGTSLAGEAATTGTWAPQVVEIPAIAPTVAEFVFEAVRRPCCSRLDLPAVPPEAATCTGPVLTALAATLLGKYHLSRDAAADLLSSVLGMPLCAATVQACCARASAALGPAAREVGASLPAAATAHLDETSWKQHGVLKWLWIGVTERVTAYAIHARRGAQQLAAWFPGEFAGVVTTDRWRPYERFARRQLCWSHLQRDLQAVIDGGRAQFHRFCTAGSRQRRDRRWRALGRDLPRRWDCVFLLLDTWGVEPTNNVAERGLRSSVPWPRASQGTRTDAGSAFVERVLTAVENCRRPGRRVLDFVAESLLAHRSGHAPPSLVPP